MREPDFTVLAERHRRELHIHCYRMLASFHEADDAVQEAFLRAWRHRGRLSGDDNDRAWLYRIAPNVCLDMLRTRARRLRRMRWFAKVPWLEPYPTHSSNKAVADPGSVAVDRETIELAFLAGLQALPPRQRVALVARDVLGWPAGETAELLETSVAGANSAVQRARALEASGPGDQAWSVPCED